MTSGSFARRPGVARVPAGHTQSHDLWGVSTIARVTCVYAICHCVVDLACVTTLMGAVAPSLAAGGPQASALAILAYDLLAFCLQLPLGALLDVVGRRRSLDAAMLSFALVAAGVSCGMAQAPIPAVVLVALGNALFHDVGGVEVLGESQGRDAPSGLFIATGAAGVFGGSLPGFNRWAGAPYLLLCLLFASAALVLSAPRSDEPGGLSVTLTGRGWMAVALLAATVALRSYTGLMMGFPWKASVSLVAAAVAAVVAGKAAGGAVADAIGPLGASVLSLGAAAVLFAFSWTSVPAGLGATLLFNFTMAITLGELARLLPDARGMAFGIASFSLALGALPALLGLGFASAPLLSLLSILSLVLLLAGLLCAHGAFDG